MLSTGVMILIRKVGNVPDLSEANPGQTELEDNAQSSLTKIPAFRAILFQIVDNEYICNPNYIPRYGTCIGCSSRI
jgi:hypothetical protein